MNFSGSFFKLKSCLTFKKIGLSFFFYFVAVVTAFAALRIESQLSSRTMVLGDEAILQLKIDGTRDGVELQFPEVHGLSFRQVGPPSSSSQTVVINGKVKSFSGLIYQIGISASQKGFFQISPITIRYDGATYKTEPRELKVILPGHQSYMKVFVNPVKQRMYVGESVEIQLEWRLESRVEDYLFRFPLLSRKDELNLKLKEPRKNGKVVNLTVSGYKVPFIRENSSGKGYTSYKSAFTVYPKTSGVLKIPAANVKAQIQTGYETRRDFFGDMVKVPRRENIFTTSKASEIQVVALPEKNRPEFFSGAVGQYQIQIAADAARVKVGDPIDVTIKIHGDGQLEHIERPLLSELPEYNSNFSIVENLQPGEVKDNTIIFHQIIRAKNDSVQQIPEVPFTFFNPVKEKYQTITSHPVKLKVLSTRKVSASDINIYTNREKSVSMEFEQSNRGIQANYIFENAVLPQTHNRYWIFYLILPPLLYSIMFSIFSYRKSVKEDKTHLKAKAAKGNMKKHLKNAQSLLSNETTEFFDELSSALTGFMSAKLNYGENAITALDINKLSMEQKIPDKLARKTAWLMEEFDRIRYTNMHCTTEDKEKLYQETQNILQKIDKSL